MALRLPISSLASGGGGDMVSNGYTVSKHGGLD